MYYLSILLNQAYVPNILYISCYPPYKTKGRPFIRVRDIRDQCYHNQCWLTLCYPVTSARDKRHLNRCFLSRLLSVCYLIHLYNSYAQCLKFQLNDFYLYKMVLQYSSPLNLIYIDSKYSKLFHARGDAVVYNSSMVYCDFICMLETAF